MTGYNGHYDRHDPAKVAAFKARREATERGKSGYVAPMLNVRMEAPWVVERNTVSLVHQLAAYLAALTLLILAVGIYLLAGYLARGNHWWLMLAPIGFGVQQAGFRHAFTTWRKAH